ncbi:MAG TPA: SRPBCC family protein [Dehalococcoidia bacterium]|jgi:hypothetical protein
MQLTASVAILRGQDDVFAYLASRTNLPEWSSGVGAVKKVTKGVVGAGTRFRIENKIGGRMLASTYEITAFDAPASISGRNTGLLSFDETFDLLAVQDGTEVTQRAEVTIGGHFLFLAPLLKLMLTSQIKKDLAGLKRVLEGQAVNAGAESQAGAE